MAEVLVDSKVHTIFLVTHDYRELKISGNKFKKFPQEVTCLPNLQLLDLSLNQVELSPVVLVSRNNISKIEELPESGLPNLMVVDLNLNENQLQYLGEGLWLCPRLKILRLQNNQLSLNNIPEALLAESSINTILLEGNRFELKALHDLEGWEQYQERQTDMKRKMD